MISYNGKICTLLRAVHVALLRMREFVLRILQHWLASVYPDSFPEHSTVAAALRRGSGAFRRAGGI